jgi:hypothetical protein
VPVRVAVDQKPLPPIGRGGAVVGRDGEVRGALEDREGAGLFGDERDGLDARRAGSDDRDPQAREVDPLVRPPTGEVDLPANEPAPSMSGDLGTDRQPVAMM